MPTLGKINNAFSRINYPDLKTKMRKIYNQCYGDEEWARTILMNIVFKDVKLKTCERGRNIVENYLKSRKRTAY